MKHFESNSINESLMHPYKHDKHPNLNEGVI